MSCKHRRDTLTSFLFVVTVYLYTFQVSYSVSLGPHGEGLPAYKVQESTATGRERITRGEDAQRGDRETGEPPRGPRQRKSNRPRRTELRPESAVFPAEPVPFHSAPTLDGSLSWTLGKVRPGPRSSASDSEDGYQADFTGFRGVQGKVFGPSFESSSHLSEWLAMNPVVQCEDGVMTFTASGKEFRHLFVDRERASPISLFQLPPYCRYSVRKSRKDLEMMVPYDACYVTQQNGSYVLPMKWWDSPLKLSCPVQTSTPAPPVSNSALSVLCSSFGMEVQINGLKQDVQILGVLVKGRWSSFVSEECAYRVTSHTGTWFTFFIPYGAPCVTRRNGPDLHLLLNDQEYIFSCPLNSQFPDIPSLPQLPTQEQMAQLPGIPPIPRSPYPGFQYPQYPHLLQVYPPSPQPTQTTVAQATSSPNINPEQESSPHQFPKLPVGSSEYASGWHYPYNPFYYPAATPAPTSAAKESTTTTAVLPTQEQIAKLPGIPHPPYPGFQYPHLLQVYPPGPQPTQTTVAQATSSPNINPEQESSPHQFPKLPVGSSEYASGWHYPYKPFYDPAATPAPTSAAKESTTTTAVPPASPNYPWYYQHMPYYPSAPGTQAPASFDPSQHPVRGAFHPPDSYSSYYPYGQFFYPGLEVQPASSSHPIAPPSPFPPTTTRTMAPPQPGSPSYPSGQFPAQTPICYPLPTTLLPANSPPNAHAICSHYPYPYYHPLYPPPYHSPTQPLPQDPETQPPITTTTTPPTTSSTESTTAGPTSQIPYLQCLVGKLVIFLPFAHPDSIQVRDQMETWLLVSVVSPLCGYMLQSAEGYGVILHSPLPACHSQLLTPTTVSLTLRFWDLSVALYRSLELRCPTNDTPVPVTPPVSPTPPSTTEDKVDPTVVPKSKVYCSSHQMTVELPSGPFSGIAFKDIKGNQMSFQDAPEHCGYSARKGKDGKIHLTIQLLSRCHMSVQDKMYMITVVYMTVNGRREAQFSCPVIIPGSGRECNLPSEQRLPCGPDSVSLPQCRSMGCCFDSHPLACYYPMDECTIDRHFVFSVSASLTEPPLFPGLLVVAGNSTCKPQRVTADYALFKIPMDGCGTRRVVVGNAVIYMVEVINKVQSISLNYGTITRDSPVRLLVECRFVPGTLLSVSYLVKTPTLGPEIPAQGTFGVQLRIAKDAQYSSYYPQNHPPLQMLLGKPLYLEVRLLNASDPSLVLLVHFCVAYPLSGKAVWLLLYNGCPNPMDPALQQAVLSGPRPPTPRAQTRRFTINTFQFLPDGESMDQDEENNFMCSTEICSPRDGPCVEGCFGQ